MIEELFASAQCGDIDRLKALLEKDRTLAHTENGEGLTLLGYAAHFGHTEAVQVLLECGADVNAISHSKISFIPSNTALHAAIAGERDMGVIHLLLAHHADPNLYDSNGHTALHTAAFHDGNEDLIKLLIQKGADVNARAEDGSTSLEIAEKQGNRRVWEVLREHKAGNSNGRVQS